jgi:hypothetical protein
MRTIAAVAATLALASCTWVEPDSGGIAVEVARPGQDLGGCVRRGEVTVSVKADIAGIDRSEVKVRDELESLARNEAASLRATHVQALDEPHRGEQRFAAYDCG